MIDIREIVFAIQSQFNDGVYGFFLNTDLGVLAVEQLTEDIDDMSPVEVRRWSDAPATNLCVRYRHTNADFWLGIGHANLRKFPTHAHIVEAVIKTMFMNILGSVPDEDIVDAGIAIYLTEAENKNVSFHLIYDEFMKMNVEFIPRQYDCVNAIVEKLLHTRIDAAWRVIKKARDIVVSQQYSQYIDRFYKPYYMDLFALVLYAVGRNPELSITIGREKFMSMILRDNWDFGV